MSRHTKHAASKINPTAHIGEKVHQAYYGTGFSGPEAEIIERWATIPSRPHTSTWNQLEADTIALVRDAVETRDADKFRRLADAVECLPPAFTPANMTATTRPTMPKDPSLTLPPRAYHAHRSTEARDPYRMAILNTFIGSSSTRRRPPTMDELLDELSDTTGVAYDRAQVAKDCKTLGLKCARATYRRTRKHVVGDIGDESSVLLVNAIDPATGKRARRIVRQ